MAKYPILTDEMFRDMMQSDKGIREARYATGYGRWLNGESVTDGHYVNWPDYRSKREISEEQREFAMQRFEERKAETMEYCSKKGILTWHRMGGDYTPTVDDGIGNYRIRTTFKDKTGHVWFIEIHPRYDKQMRGSDTLGFYGEVYDVSWNDQAMKEYTERYDALMEKYGSWWKSPTNERPALPMTKYERIESKELFTYASVLAWVNAWFKTDYKEMFLERYFLNCDDVISEC